MVGDDQARSGAGERLEPDVAQTKQAKRQHQADEAVVAPAKQPLCIISAHRGTHQAAQPEPERDDQRSKPVVRIRQARPELTPFRPLPPSHSRQTITPCRPGPGGNCEPFVEDQGVDSETFR